VTDTPATVRVGTRGSELARRQTDEVVTALRHYWPTLKIVVRVITTTGDVVTDKPLPQIAGEGVFTSALERALLEDEIDLAVHSLKDMPIALTPGTQIGAIPARAHAADVLVSREGYTLETLPDNAVIGTSSRRRAAQLRHQRPDAQIKDIRGNVDTRIRKAYDPANGYDAIVLARAGLERLGRLEDASQTLPLDVMLPAPGQAALAVQCRAEADWRVLLAPLNHPETAAAVAAERGFLRGLGGGCALPVAAYATATAEELHLRGRIIAFDGSVQIDVEDTFSTADPTAAGARLAQQALAKGGARLLEVLS
jgi:hydroxymethylbilane synthase